MKNFLRMGLFAVVAGSVLSLLPMSVSALQPPQLIVVEGLEGYKLLVQLAGTDNSRDYTDILIYMTNNNLIHGDMHLVSSSSLARDFAHVRRFVEGIEALKIPVRRGANLDDVFFDFHFGDNVDGRVASWRTTVLIDNAVISFMVMEREYIEGTVIATRQPNAWGTWLHPYESSLIQDNQYQRSSYLISQGNLRIRVSLFVLGDADFYAME
ncbi:MAG: hypothetical protein FWC89_11370, partial [Defluviitaleaceae bacterium]|nr:hypothetical protein [Defluviitaleaceae bacterium]